RAVLYEELREAGVLGPHPPGSRQPGEPARASLALADATPLRLVREHLRAVALHGVQAAPRDRLHLSLLAGSGRAGAIFSADEWRRVQPRMRELTYDEPIGAAVRRPRRPRAAVDWQARYAGEQLTDLLGWFGLPAAIVDRLTFFWRG